MILHDLVYWKNLTNTCPFILGPVVPFQSRSNILYLHTGFLSQAAGFGGFAVSRSFMWMGVDVVRFFICPFVVWNSNSILPVVMAILALESIESSCLSGLACWLGDFRSWTALCAIQRAAERRSRKADNDPQVKSNLSRNNQYHKHLHAISSIKRYHESSQGNQHVSTQLQSFHDHPRSSRASDWCYLSIQSGAEHDVAVQKYLEMPLGHFQFGEGTSLILIYRGQGESIATYRHHSTSTEGNSDQFRAHILLPYAHENRHGSQISHAFRRYLQSRTRRSPVYTQWNAFPQGGARFALAWR